jgi:hypothetical protein
VGGGDEPLSAQVQALSASRLGKSFTEKKTIAEVEKAVVGVKKPVVFEAYDWKLVMSDEAILEALLALNLERIRKQ